MRFVARCALLAAMVLGSQGCFRASYLSQAARGEMDILGPARPIRDVVADDGTPARVRRLLSAVRTVKAFGQQNGLAPTASYRSYADLGTRPTAVWVVEACPPLAFDVKRWEFPLIGSVPYLGFFDEAAARRYARTLSSAGLDVDVRTAGAFSTLGWFRDPVLSTMIAPGDEALGELANVILHESVHATLYVQDQSAFDESLASFVADRLTPRWLDSVLGPAAPETAAWAAAHRRARARIARLHRAYTELDAVYRSAASDDVKRAEKARILAETRAELHLSRAINNAVLADFKAYDSGTGAFERLLAHCGGSWPRMMRTVREVRGSDFAQPQQDRFDAVIDRLTRAGCAR